MQKRTLIVLAVLFGGLLAYVLIVEVGQKEEREEREAQQEQVLALTEDDVRAVRVEGSLGAVAIELRGDAVTGEWFLTEPFEQAADPATARALARSAATVKEERVLEEVSDDIGQYGLDQPSLVVRIDAEGLEAPQVLRFGSETGSKDGRYLQIEGQDEIRIVPAFQYRALDKNVDDLRDKRIVRFSTGAVTHITVTGPATQVQLDRVDGNWRLGGESLPYRAARRDVEDLLADLTTSRAKRFLDADDPSLGLEETERWLLLELEDGEQIRIDVAEPRADSVVVQVRGSTEAAEMGSFLARPLVRGPDEWRTDEVADINPWQASEIRFTYGGKSFEIRQDEEQSWTLSEGTEDPTPIDAERARDVLRAVDDLRATAFLAPGTEIGPEVGQVEVVTEGQPVVRFTLHRSGDSWATRTDGDPSPLQVDGSLGLFFEEFLADPSGVSQGV